MTANFSLAFMTTVVGLPISALLRSLIVVTHAKDHPNNQAKSPEVAPAESRPVAVQMEGN